MDQLQANHQQPWRQLLLRELSIKERVKIMPQHMPQQDPKERIKNFEEVNFGYTEELAIKEARRCLDCREPRCVAGCPVGIDIPSFIKLIERGEFIAAARKLKETNALPAICGRVCPQEIQCQLNCTAKKATGYAVNIGHLERFAADYERNSNEVYIPPRPKPTAKKIAVIGAGPGGLTCAAELALMGHSVVVFEALHKPGGVLAYGIPTFRLPKDILEAEVNYLLNLGVEIELNFVVGKTATIEDLKAEGFHAFFIATGAGLPHYMGIPGEALGGIYSANEYLIRVNLMKAYLFPEYDTPIYKGRRVAVIGGGNTALDAVRTAKRLGAEHAYIVYRRTRAEMPARDEEVAHAEEEGIEFMMLTLPKRFIADNDGWLCAMECIKMQLGEPDESGRARPVPVAGSEFILEVDCAIIAIGRTPNPIIINTTPQLKAQPSGAIIVDQATMMTSIEGIFAGGDAIRGDSTVILAMGDAKKAANSINQYLSAKAH